MDSSSLEFPFEKLFIAVVGNNKRAYTRQGPARARITGAVSEDTELFKHGCELWSIDNDGWHLIFICVKDDHSSLIPWNNISETRKKRNNAREEYMKKVTDSRDREEYERLKMKFDN